jgi:hypothetical protein
VAKPSKSDQFHESFAREDDVEGSSDRSFGFVMTVAFSIYALWPITRGEELRSWPLAAAVAFVVPALVYPRSLAPLNKLWMKLGLLLGKVMSPIILGVLFFTTITPLGLLMRMLGKDVLRLRWDKGAKSYWIQRTPPGPPPETMSNQF